MVHFTDVRVPVENLIGEEGKGWTYAKYLLEFERGNAYSHGLKASLEGVRGMAAAESDGSGKSMVNNVEFNQINEKFLLTPKKLMDLRALVTKYYRDKLNPADLLDNNLVQESYRFLDELTQLLDLGNVYDFQKI